MLGAFELDKKNEKGKKNKGLRWCQGAVVDVIKTKAKPTGKGRTGRCEVRNSYLDYIFCLLI